MKKLLAVCVLVLAFTIGAFAQTQSGDSPSDVSISAAMPLNGSWVILDQFMSVGDYFTGSWDWDEPYLVRFTITDLYVISDQFEVYDNGALVATTPVMPDWDDLGYGSPGVGGPFPPWTGDADVAFGSGLFSSAVLYFGPGAHSITIRDIHIPPISADGPPFGDGTVAFKAEPLVEFAKEITDTVEGGDGDGVLETGEDWHWTLTATLTNISGETITDIRMHDRLGGDLEWHWVSWNFGSDLDIDYKGKTEKVFFNWYDGFDLAPGASATFSMNVSPDINTGTGNGKKSGKQEYTSPGEHCLNSGAWFEGYIGDEHIEASTQPVCVDVVEAD